MGMIDDSKLVFQNWMFRLPMQQQSVLLLACRGPDGVAKFHPCKPIVAAYRASVLKAAYLGRAMKMGESDDTTFMSLEGFDYQTTWDNMVEVFFNYIDELQHHYYLHLIHGAEIIGYKHNVSLFRERWQTFYYDCCSNLHMMPEKMSEMDFRLSDWHQKYWDV